MSIESVLKEYLQRYGIQNVQFDSKGFFSVIVDTLGIFSCEHTPDGIVVALFKEIPPSEKADFMERALKAVNPIENDVPYTMRPVIYESKAGIVAPIQKDAITLPTVSTIVDSLFRTLQNTVRA